MSAPFQDAIRTYGYGEHQRAVFVLCSCPTCGALVLEEHILRHEQWHDELWANLARDEKP